MKQKHIIVIGAGPAGLTSAYKLCQAGHRVTVYESSDQVGGLSRSFRLWGQMVDLGPHRFFSKLDIVNNFFFEVLQSDYAEVNRVTRIYYRGHFLSYPLEPLDGLSKLGFLEAIRCFLSYLLARMNRHLDLDSFEGWVTSRFGKRLFNIFFKTYTEKVWGISCSQIDAEWAAQRIKKLSLLEALKNALRLDAREKHKSLIDKFNYPTKGTGSIYLRLQELIEKQGGRVILKTPARKIILEDGRSNSQRAVGVILENGSQIDADAVISTMPLTLMVQNLNSAPENIKSFSKSLQYRNTILVYLKIPIEECFPDNWIYVHSPKVLHGRITNFRNWPTAKELTEPISIICMEFWCFDDDPIWQQAESEIAATAMLELREVFDWAKDLPDVESKIVKLRRSYPVYKLGYRNELDPIIDYLKNIENLFPIGRYGAFKYNNQDHSILMGLLAAEKISENLAIDLWSINTDSDYQEMVWGNKPSD